MMTGENHQVLLFIYLSCPWPELLHWSWYKYMIFNRAWEISQFSLPLIENIAAFILLAAAVEQYCNAKWLGVEWKNGFNSDKVLEWNISNQQVAEIKMCVTFLQWGSNPCWQQYHIVYQLVRIVQNCIFWHGKRCISQSKMFFVWNGKLNLLLILILLLSSRPESGISRFTHRLSLKERGAKAEKPSPDWPLSYRRRSLSVDW